MNEERGVSVTLSYILMLIIATIVFVGVVSTAGVIIDAQTDHAMYEQLGVAGQTLAADLHNADRLMNIEGTEEISVKLRSNLPESIVDHPYQIIVNGTANEIVLKTEQPDIETSVSFQAQHISEGEMVVDGGVITIQNDGDQLEIREAQS